jgi:uncharacterized protein (AIM24 family)
MTAFINQNNTKSKVSFASPYPGKIIPIDLTQFEENSFARKILSFARPKVFLLESNSQKIGTGLFGGRFHHAKIEGDGLLVHTGGTLAKKELAEGEI